MKKYRVINTIHDPRYITKYFDTREQAGTYIAQYSVNYLRRNWKTYREDFICWTCIEYSMLTKKEIASEISHLKNNYFTIERRHVRMVVEWI